jgi:hypothetical protein
MAELKEIDKVSNWVLKGLVDGDFNVTPKMYDPETGQPKFGIMQETENGPRLRFVIKIEDLASGN